MLKSMTLLDRHSKPDPPPVAVPWPCCGLDPAADVAAMGIAAMGIAAMGIAAMGGAAMGVAVADIAAMGVAAADVAAAGPRACDIYVGSDAFLQVADSIWKCGHNQMEFAGQRFTREPQRS